MREIKFRAWDKTHKKMLDRVLAGPGDPCSIVYDEERKDWVQFDDACGELMQFTGLKDKNGKEIFEGDIVQIENMYSERKVARVMWGKVSPMYTWMIGETWLLHFARDPETHLDVEGPIFPYCDRHNGYEVSIIGNIYENVELIPKDE